MARPWGTYDGVDVGERFLVKRIIVKPGASLSLQMHFHRAEHWIVVRGTARVTREDSTYMVSENESTFIPLGQKHRLENPGRVPLEMIEVQSGSLSGRRRYCPLWGQLQALGHKARPSVRWHTDRTALFRHPRRNNEQGLQQMIQGTLWGREGSFLRKSGEVSRLEDAANGTLAHRQRRAPTQLCEWEIEITHCLRKGKSDQEIGSSLAISAYTVKNRLQRIFGKLAVFNRTHAVSKFFMADQAPEA